MKRTQNLHALIKKNGVSGTMLVFKQLSIDQFCSIFLTRMKLEITPMLDPPMTENNKIKSPIDLLVNF